MIDKDLVKNSFTKNLKTYEQNASVQKDMAQRLISMLPQKKFFNVFEIGMGCGIMTKMLCQNIEYENYSANDIVEACEKYLIQINKSANFINGDIENIVLPENLDLIISNAAFQWLTDFKSFIQKIKTSMKKDSILAFSTFGEANFLEIKISSNKGLDYISFEQLQKILASEFEIISARERFETIYFPTVKDVFRHIKKTGVNAISSEPLSIGELRRIEKKYEDTYFSAKGYSLTYNPLYFVVKNSL